MKLSVSRSKKEQRHVVLGFPSSLSYPGRTARLVRRSTREGSTHSRAASAISFLLKQHNDVAQPGSGYGRHRICVLLAQMLMRAELFEGCCEVSRLVAKSIFMAAELVIEPQQLNRERGFSEAFKWAVMTAAIRFHGSAPQANGTLTAHRAFHSELRYPQGWHCMCDVLNTSGLEIWRSHAKIRRAENHAQAAYRGSK